MVQAICCVMITKDFVLLAEGRLVRSVLSQQNCLCRTRDWLWRDTMNVRMLLCSLLLMLAGCTKTPPPFATKQDIHDAWQMLDPKSSTGIDARMLARQTAGTWKILAILGQGYHEGEYIIRKVGADDYREIINAPTLALLSTSPPQAPAIDALLAPGDIFHIQYQEPTEAYVHNLGGIFLKDRLMWYFLRIKIQRTSEPSPTTSRRPADHRRASLCIQKMFTWRKVMVTI